MKAFVWLASYPKSGNTWFRVFLANYLRNADAPVDINQLDEAEIASAREPFDVAVGYDSSEMKPAEIERLRPEVYRYRARTAAEPLYAKVHDAWTRLPDGAPLFPPDVTRAALYFVRNPLDVCASFASHAGHDDFARVVRMMGDPQHVILGSGGSENHQLAQRLLTWSQHVLSWTEAPAMPVHVVRFEDLKFRAEETFTAAVRFLGLPIDAARVQKAVAFSRFEELRRQEAERGFVEKLPQAERFFRKGEVGTWRESLPPELARQLVADHGAVMHRFGYLTAAGEPVF